MTRRRLILATRRRCPLWNGLVAIARPPVSGRTLSGRPVNSRRQPRRSDRRVTQSASINYRQPALPPEPPSSLRCPNSTEEEWPAAGKGCCGLFPFVGGG